MKLRYIIEEEVGDVHEESGELVELWLPLKSSVEDRIHVKTGDGVRIFDTAGLAYKFMNRVRKRMPRGTKLRVKKVELS